MSPAAPSPIGNPRPTDPFLLTQILRGFAKGARSPLGRAGGAGEGSARPPLYPENTKQRSRRIISHNTVPVFGRNTPGTEAVSRTPP